MKIISITTLSLSFFIYGCSDKNHQTTSNTKPASIEITHHNDVGSDKKSSLSADHNSISGIKIGDSINRIDLVFGVDTSHEKWFDHCEKNKSCDPSMSGISFSSFSLDKAHEYHLLHLYVAKNSQNKIVYLSCYPLLGFDEKYYMNDGSAGEMFFYINPTPCRLGNFKFFSPITRNSSFSPNELGLIKQLGEPSHILSYREVKDNFYIRDQMDSKRSTRLLDYGNLKIYSDRDRLVGFTIISEELLNSIEITIANEKIKK
jgi:hypothetical protein